jgi:hypothetical protein
LAIVLQIGTTRLTRPESKRNPNANRAATTLRVNNENASGNATNPTIYHGSKGIERWYVKPCINTTADEAPNRIRVAHIKPLTKGENIVTTFNETDLSKY